MSAQRERERDKRAAAELLAAFVAFEEKLEGGSSGGGGDGSPVQVAILAALRPRDNIWHRQLVINLGRESHWANAKGVHKPPPLPPSKQRQKRRQRRRPRCQAVSLTLLGRKSHPQRVAPLGAGAPRNNY